MSTQELLWPRLLLCKLVSVSIIYNAIYQGSYRLSQNKMTIALSMFCYASGLDNMYMLTMNNERIYKLRVDLSVDTGYSHYAEYSQFSVTDEAENYRILLGVYSGTAGNVSTKLIWVAKTAITTISELGHWHPKLQTSKQFCLK